MTITETTQEIITRCQNDRSLERREKRAISGVLLLNKKITDLLGALRKEAVGKIDGKKVQKLLQTQNKLATAHHQIIDKMKLILLQESTEIDRDESLPLKALTELDSVLLPTLEHLKETINPNSQLYKQIELQIHDILTTFEQFYHDIGQEFVETKTLFDETLAGRRTLHGDSATEIDKEQSVALQWEHKKIAITRSIGQAEGQLDDLLKKLKPLKKSNAAHQGIQDLVDEQIRTLEVLKEKVQKELAIQVARQKSEQPIRPSRNIHRLSSALAKAASMEPKIIANLTESKVIEAADSTTERLLRVTKTTSGVYPIEYWLGDKRAVGFLRSYLSDKNIKSLVNLEGVLAGGLLDKNSGMLILRKEAIAEILAGPGFAGAAVFTNTLLKYLEEYKNSMGVLLSFIHERLELSRKILGLYGATLQQLATEMEQAESQVIAVCNEATIDQDIKAANGNQKEVKRLNRAKRQVVQLRSQAGVQFAVARKASNQGIERAAVAARTQYQVAQRNKPLVSMRANRVTAAAVALGIFFGGIGPGVYAAKNPETITQEVVEEIEQQVQAGTFEAISDTTFGTSEYKFDKHNEFITNNPDVFAQSIVDQYQQDFSNWVLKEIADGNKNATFADYLVEHQIEVRISADGWACPIGRKGYNKKLSQKRSQEIIDGIVKFLTGLGFKVVGGPVAVGHGEAAPQRVMQDLEAHANTLPTKEKNQLLVLVKKYKSAKFGQKKKVFESIIRSLRKSSFDQQTLGVYRAADVSITVTGVKEIPAQTKVVKKVKKEEIVKYEYQWIKLMAPLPGLIRTVEIEQTKKRGPKVETPYRGQGKPVGQKFLHHRGRWVQNQYSG